MKHNKLLCRQCCSNYSQSKKIVVSLNELLLINFVIHGRIKSIAKKNRYEYVISFSCIILAIAVEIAISAVNTI